MECSRRGRSRQRPGRRTRALGHDVCPFSSSDRRKMASVPRGLTPCRRCRTCRPIAPSAALAGPTFTTIKPSTHDPTARPSACSTSSAVVSASALRTASELPVRTASATTSAARRLRPLRLSYARSTFVGFLLARVGAPREKAGTGHRWSSLSPATCDAAGVWKIWTLTWRSTNVPGRHRGRPTRSRSRRAAPAVRPREHRQRSGGSRRWSDPARRR